MSIENENVGMDNKKSIFSKIKFFIILVLVFVTVLATTFAILYFANPKAKEIINKEITLYKAQKELNNKSNSKTVSSDDRISKLAKHYLEMEESAIVDKLTSIKKSDKKTYEKIVSSMGVINRKKTENIKDRIKINESKKDIVKKEYEAMLLEQSEENIRLSKYYKKLGLKGSIDAIEKELKETMGYEKVCYALKDMKIKDVAKIMYYMNPIYHQGIKNRFDSKAIEELEREIQTYSEFLRSNLSLGSLYSDTDEVIAAKELQDDKKFKEEQLAVIFLGMDYFKAAKILDNFEDESKVQEILENIKKIEDYQNKIGEGFSEILSKSIKVLKKYDRDVDKLKEAYQKMEATELADIIDKLVSSEPVYKVYQISGDKNFKITEKQMVLDTLKRVKPKLVGEVLAELKNHNKTDKAAYLSRELGIPTPTN